MTDKQIIKADIIEILNNADGMEHVAIYCANDKGENETMVKVTDIIKLLNSQKAELVSRTEEYNDMLHQRNKCEEFIEEQQKEISDLTYKLMGVMHSVDKWLDGDELKQDEVNRAATMREKTLRIVEQKQAQNKELWGERNRIYESLKETEAELEEYRKAYLNSQAEIERLKNAYKQCAWERDVFAEDCKSEAIKEYKEKVKALLMDKGFYPVLVKNALEEAEKEFTKGEII